MGVRFPELRLHLEKQFYDNSKTGEAMSWDNYGLKGWHIDHIKPISSFNIANHDEFLEAFNYKNLQPLWCFDNFSKHNRLDWVHPRDRKQPHGLQVPKSCLGEAI